MTYSSLSSRLRKPLGLLFLLAATLENIVDAQGYDNSCYYAKGKPAGSAFLPCKDPSEYGVASCCQNGDICLSDNACWNQQYNITYQYGCTDENYDDPSCPTKCDLDVGKSYNYISQSWQFVVEAFTPARPPLAAPCQAGLCRATDVAMAA